MTAIPKRAKWFTDLPKDEQKAIMKREKEYREELFKKYFSSQEKKDNIKSSEKETLSESTE